MPCAATLVAVPLLVLQAPAPPPPGPGDSVPDFALRDLAGAEHRLSDQRGRIVVLEWTSPLCPAVAAVHEPGLAADTRAAARGDDVVWWQVDSSWFAPNLADELRAWRRRLGLDDPCLLDPDGAVARAVGARATPHFFVVDRDGALAYSGALGQGATEAERENHVVAAVRALRAGARPRVARTRALGCSVKIGRPDPDADTSGFEGARARAHYRDAAAAARAGRADDALEAYAAALEAGWTPSLAPLADDAFRTLLHDGDVRVDLRRLVGDRPPRGHARIVAPKEPGTPFVLAGTVRDADGGPIEGAVVSLYQTDDAGWYAPGSTSGDNPRLFGRVATDSRGRWRVRTVLPGYYAGATEGLRHFHMGFRAEGYEPHEGHRASLYFDDDPFLKGAWRAEIEGDGCAIRPRAANAEGVSSAVYDVVLARR